MQTLTINWGCSVFLYKCHVIWRCHYVICYYCFNVLTLGEFQDLSFFNLFILYFVNGNIFIPCQPMFDWTVYLYQLKPVTMCYSVLWIIICWKDCCENVSFYILTLSHYILINCLFSSVSFHVKSIQFDWIGIQDLDI